MGWPPISPELIVAAYCQGIFPMADDRGRIGWYSPDPRAIFPLEPGAFHVPKSLQKTIRQGTFDVTIDRAFLDVMRGCADRDLTWINDDILKHYNALFEKGICHSVEAWHEGKLAGGLYGVALGGAFMGESMFTRVTDASKVCLVHLVEHLRKKGYVLLDSQMPTEHLQRFGQILISKEDYLKRLKKALTIEARFS